MPPHVSNRCYLEAWPISFCQDITIDPINLEFDTFSITELLFSYLKEIKTKNMFLQKHLM